jgi:hypothetical protein
VKSGERLLDTRLFRAVLEARDFDVIVRIVPAALSEENGLAVARRATSRVA